MAEKELVTGLTRETQSYSLTGESYSNLNAHILDEFRWLNRLIAAQVLRLRRVDFYDKIKDFRSFFIADEEIDTLLRAGIFEDDSRINEKELTEETSKLLAEAQDLREQISRRVQKSIAEDSLPIN